MYRFVPSLIVFALLASVTPTAARAEEAPQVVVPAPAPATEPEPPAPPATINPATPAAPAAPIPSPPPSPPVAPSPVTTLALTQAPRPEARFGDAGVRVVGGMISTNLYHSAGNGTETTFSIAPTFDYFLAPSFSAGASVLVGYEHADPSAGVPGFTNWTLEVTGQLGFNVWLGERLSLWPRVALGVEQMRRATLLQLTTLPTNGNGGMTTSAVVAASAVAAVTNIVSAEIYAPLLFHLVPHFFLGFGPSFTADLHNSTPAPEGGSSRRTILGASSLVGGWF